MEGLSSLDLSSLSAGFNFDEVCVRQRQRFSESLKDLKDLKAQLYSAAQQFEQSYNHHHHRHMGVNTAKEYAMKSLVNSVDHLGSLAYKVETLVNENIEVLSCYELRLSSLQQRIQMCREHVTQEGSSQQSLSITTPNHHKRYILPAVEKKVQRREEMHRQDCVVSGMTTGSDKADHGIESSPIYSFSLGSKSCNRRKSGRRSSSPFRFLARSGSLKDRSTSPNPTASKARRSPSEPRKSSSTFMRAETDETTGDIHLYTGRNGCLLETLLSIRRSRK